MSWTKNHEVSERMASQAQAALREGRQREALDLYARAAHAEELAVADMDTAKVRTLGISAVSAVSLYYKAAKFERAEEVAARWLGSNPLPAFAREQLRSLLQSIWSEQTRNNADVRFAQGQVLVSVQGGEVVSGGAPLDLIMDKVKTVQSLFHRTAEFLGGREHRRRGAPSQDIQDSCRPWLFQSTPGSYQFAVAIQKEYQQNFLTPVPTPEDVAECFLRILRAICRPTVRTSISLDTLIAREFSQEEPSRCAPHVEESVATETAAGRFPWGSVLGRTSSPEEW